MDPASLKNRIEALKVSLGKAKDALGHGSDKRGTKATPLNPTPLPYDDNEKPSREKLTPEQVAQWDRHVEVATRTGVPIIPVDQWMRGKMGKAKDRLGHGSDARGSNILSTHEPINPPYMSGQPVRMTIQNNPHTGLRMPFELWAHYESGGSRHQASFKTVEAAERNAARRGYRKLQKIAYRKQPNFSKPGQRSGGNAMLDRDDQDQDHAVDYGLREPTEGTGLLNPTGNKDRTQPPIGSPSDNNNATPGEMFTKPPQGSVAFRTRAQADLLNQRGVPPNKPRKQVAGYVVTGRGTKFVTKGAV